MITDNEARRLLALKTEEDVFARLRNKLNSRYLVEFNPKLAYRSKVGGQYKQVNEFCDVLVTSGNKAYAFEVKTCFSEKEKMTDWLKSHIPEAKRQTYKSIKEIEQNSVAAEHFGVEGNRYSWYLIAVLAMDETKICAKDEESRAFAHKRTIAEELFFVDTKVLLMSEILNNDFSDMEHIMNMDAMLS